MRSASEGVLRRYLRYARAAAGGILVNEDGSAEGAAHLTKRAAKEGRLRPPLRYPYVRATRLSLKGWVPLRPNNFNSTKSASDVRKTLLGCVPSKSLPLVERVPRIQAIIYVLYIQRMISTNLYTLLTRAGGAPTLMLR